MNSSDELQAMSDAAQLTETLGNRVLITIDTSKEPNFDLNSKFI